ncbi:nuclear transport factor 2 family protein [Nocardia veterana]|uniref:Nuclear transport factor 2 family protein n=1 Tax=Nocardia veterana TaxID=132249 RepID=A0A7X6M4I4_9NOCA|nr:nuclear transport factor 2 family protein [Nocardia veterana]NKY89052.1 nuclear transport factor 2 family protein [Nocardia veterana]
MDLVALEEIRALKYRYLRTLDMREWDEFADTLAEDAVADYGSPSGGKPLQFEGRAAIVGYLSGAMSGTMITSHVCSHPEIAIDGDTASGSWCLEDTVIVPEHGIMIRGAAYYRDTYRREADGRWRITRTGYQRNYETMVPLAAMPGFTITASRWDPSLSH